MSDDKAEDIAPPFHGFIATTYDALLVFEAARRGMIPRVTRRLNDSERNLVQSGSVFVYDEQESGIKRWTDGHSWSPSRILANFLVYRETIKPADSKDAKDDAGIKKESTPTGSRPGSSHRRDGRPATGSSGSPNNGSPSMAEMGVAYAESSRMALETANRPLVHGQMRPRSAAEAGGCRLENGIIIDRHLERKLVGSLTNSYLFQPGGLVKKTMTLTIAGFNQHVVSYYTLEDAVAGRLRRPSTIPEFASLDISPEYLNVANFRYPPSIEIGADGVPRYHGEPDDRPISPIPRMPQYGGEMYEPYGPPMPMDNAMHQPRLRSVTVPTLGGGFGSPMAPSPYAVPPGSSQGGYYEPQPQYMTPVPRQTGPQRPSTTGSRRYDPYTPPNPRTSMPSAPTTEGSHIRRQSQSLLPSDGGGYYTASDYSYQPPSTAPGSLYYSHSAPTPQQSNQPSLASPVVSPSYSTGSYAAPWHQTPSVPPMQTQQRFLAGGPSDRDMTALDAQPGQPASMSGVPPPSHNVMSSDNGSWTQLPPAPQSGWESHAPPPMPQYAVQGDGWQAGMA